MSDKGYRIDHHQVINQLRDDLRDRYPGGFSIIKEILQNAEDSEGATEVVIGTSPGFPAERHPLLRGPAVFFANNGQFKPRDAEAIHSRSFGYKSGREGYIGRYGLGLSSVYHLCDAFYYLTLPEDPPDWVGNYQPSDIINPLSAIDIHEKWNDYDVNAQALRRIKSLLCERSDIQLSGTWFCIWCPLRTVNVSGDSTLRPEFPGDTYPAVAFLLDDDLPSQIAAILPFLSKLQLVRFVPSPDFGRQGFSVSLAAGNHERLCGKTGAVHARIDCRNGSSETSLVTAIGKQVLLEAERPMLLAQNPYWPRRSAYDPSTHKPTDAREKANPHGALVFSRRLGDSKLGSLKREFCVYFPLGEKCQRQCPDYPGKSQILVSLHGNFFIDAGRTSVEWGYVDGDPSNEAELRQAWNTCIRDTIVLPLLIPSLIEFIDSCPDLENETEALVKGLTRLFADDIKHVCQKQQLLWVWDTDCGRWHWQPIEANLVFRHLPDPGAITLASQDACRSPKSSLDDLHCQVFPVLRTWRAQERGYLANEAKPALSTRSAQRWSQDEISELLSSVEVESCFSKTENVAYIAEFLSRTRIHDEIPPSSLMDLLRRALVSVSLNDLQRCLDSVKSLTKLLDEKSLFALPLLDDASSKDLERLLPALAEATHDSLPLPRDFLDHSNASLTVEEAGNYLGVLVAYTQGAALEGRHLVQEIAIQVFDHCESHDNCASLQNAKVFMGKTKTNESNLFSLRELEREHRGGSLFCEGRHCQFELLIRNVCRHDEIVVLQKRVADLIDLSAPPPVPALDGISVLKFLERRSPALREPEHRKELLKRLLQSAEIATNRSAFRYLLHGKSGAPSGATLFASSRRSAWTSLLGVVLELRTEGWRTVDHLLTEELNGGQMNELGVQPVEAEAVVAVVREMRDLLTRLDLKVLTASERRSIILQFPDEELLKSLPIHETQDGQLVSIGNRTFLPQTQIRIPDEILEGIRILKVDDTTRQRLKSLAKPLDTTVLATLLLNDPNPSRFAGTILKCAKSAPSELLRCTPWVPTADDGTAAPRDVVFPELTTASNPIRSLYPEAFAEFPSPIPEISSHENWPLCLAGTVEQAQVLGGRLAAYEEFQIGTPPIDSNTLGDFSRAFKGVPIDIMPAANLANAICVTTEDQCTEVQLAFLSQLSGVPCGERVAAILNYLSARDDEASAQNSAFWRRIHNRYLTLCNIHPDKVEVLPRVRLLNQKGEWKDPNRLVVGVEGIDKEFLLDAEQAQLLGFETSLVSGMRTEDDAVTAQPIRFEEGMISDGAARLRDYFEPWRNCVGNEVQIGAFLAFLGNAPAIIELAQSFLGHRTADGIRLNLRGTPQTIIGAGTGQSLDSLLSAQRFDICIKRGDTLQVQSLTGDSFEAALSEDFDSIFVGNFRGIWGATANRLVLRSIEPSQFTEQRLGELLRNSLDLLLCNLYRHIADGMEGFWESLSQSDQLQLSIVQDMMCDSLETLVKQMQLARVDTKVECIKSRLSRARREKAEREAKNTSCEAQTREIAECRKAFRDLIENEELVQEHCLEAVRKRLSVYEYSPDSVPFELLQNADDALLELSDMHAGAGIAGQVDPRFFVSIDPDTVAFVHFGRAINRFRLGTFDGASRGYSEDLEKMLTLNASDKGLRDDEPATTGRFGLGFKSVFLATTVPTVISGRRLAFDVVGGFWPRMISSERRGEVEQAIHRLLREANKDLTAVYLSPIVVPVREIFERFKKLGPITLAFTKAIKVLRMVESGDDQYFEWNSRVSKLLPNLEVGMLPVDDGEVRNLLLLKLSGGHLLFGLSGGKFTRLTGVPCVWVTAPTREPDYVGYVLNGPFKIDVGRNRLADASANATSAALMADALADALCRLFREWTTNPYETRQLLGSPEESTPENFWESFWEVVSAPFLSRGWREVNGVRLIREVLWPEPDRGLGAFYRQCAALPTGLQGEHARLTVVDDVRFEVRGALVGVMDSVGTWPSFRHKVPVGSAVSERFRRFLVEAGGVQFDSIYLADVLEWEFQDSNYRVSPEQALRISSCVTPQLFERLLEEERDSIQASLAQVRFMAEDGGYAAARDLLIGKSEEESGNDEVLRADFAPASNRLSPDYCDSLAFFKLCRGRMEAPAERLAQWVRTCTTERNRQAALYYLVHGELSRETSHHLRAVLTQTWLRELSEEDKRSYWLEQFNNRERAELLVHLGLLVEDDEAVPYPPHRVVDTAATLERIWNWWHENRDKYVSKHREASLPAFLEFDQMLSDNLTDAVRRHWVALWILGLCQTLGRTRPQQHRGFLEQAEQKGWLDVFADGREAGAEQWMGILDEYIEQPELSEVYQQWIRLFPAIYRISVRLSRYIENTVALDRCDGPIRIQALTLPRHYPDLPTAPPDIQRSIGIGICFVLRELVMHAVLSNPEIFPYCYVPSESVRSVLMTVRWPNSQSTAPTQTAKEIHDFLCDHIGPQRAHFDLAFDLPFRVLAADNDLFESLIEESI